MTVCCACMQGDVLIELVEPSAENSSFGSIIGSSRGGIHHICCEVDDLNREIARCWKQRCMPIVKPVPATAFQGRRVVFLLTPQRDLIEFVESALAA